MVCHTIGAGREALVHLWQGISSPVYTPLILIEFCVTVVVFLNILIRRGDDTMSAVARDYAYQVKIEKNKKKPEPTISLEVLKGYQDDVAKYLKDKK